MEWAQDHLDGIYHNEYFQIQKLNNQLIDSQRALIRSKRSLEMALSENQKINEKITLARQAAERANRSKTEFLANMSHDIRTPMNAIVGLTKLMQHSLNDPEILSGYIRKLQSSSEYLLSLINDILDMRKIDQEEIKLFEESVDLRELIRNCMEILEARAGEMAIELDTSGLDGFEASRRIRSMKRPDAAKIPIIALTANAFAEDITKSIAAGMDAHITKPINGEKLKECILHLLVSR